MTNYSNGRAREYEVRDLLTLEGYTVFRTAGSKTPADLIAAKPGEWLLVQVKPAGGGTIGRTARADLLEYADWTGAVPLVAYRPAKRQPWAFRRLTGPGPKDWQPWTADWAVTP